MIPSRPLGLGGILGETIRITGKTFLFVVLLIIVCIIPAGLWTSSNVSHFVREALVDAQQEKGWTDESIHDLQSRVRNIIELQNPGTLRIYSKGFGTVDSIRLRDSLLALPPILDSSRIISTQSATPIDPRSGSTGKIISALPKVDTIYHTTVPGTSAQLAVTQKKYSRITSDFMWGHFWKMSSDGLLILLSIFLFAFGAFFANAATIDLACRAFEERPLAFGNVLSETLRRNVWRVLAFQLVYFLALIIIPDAIVSAIQTASYAMSVFVGMLFGLARLFVAIRIIVLLPALVSEERGLIAAAKRSWALTEGNWWRIFGISMVYGIIVGILLFLILIAPIIFETAQLISWGKSFLFSPTLTLHDAVSMIASITEWLSKICVFSAGILMFFYTPFVTTLYYDLRTRLDGPLSYEIGAEHTNEHRAATHPM
ncbi:MAG: glycerophosphoryl diester phosphodiesterase membrane domain-containing protein [Candidatus Kapaibacterium sp.]|jgi:hypothetical protein